MIAGNTSQKFISFINIFVLKNPVVILPFLYPILPTHHNSFINLFKTSVFNLTPHHLLKRTLFVFFGFLVFKLLFCEIRINSFFHPHIFCFFPHLTISPIIFYPFTPTLPNLNTISHLTNIIIHTNITTYFYFQFINY